MSFGMRVLDASDQVILDTTNITAVFVDIIFLGSSPGSGQRSYPELAGLTLDWSLINGENWHRDRAFPSVSVSGHTISWSQVTNPSQECYLQVFAE